MTEEKEQNRELIMDEFLLKTVISLQVALASISKDLDQKTDLLHDISDSLTAMTYNMKEVRDRMDKKDNTSKEFLDSMAELNKKLELIEVGIENDSIQIESHVREIKYTVQQLSDSLIELKTEKKIADSQEASKKKLDILELFTNSWEAIKNVRAIFYVILAIILIVGSLIGGAGFLPEILKLVKSLLGA
jgi:archaellum component FlaC